MFVRRIIFQKKSVALNLFQMLPALKQLFRQGMYWITLFDNSKNSFSTKIGVFLADMNCENKGILIDMEIHTTYSFVYSKATNIILNCYN